MLMLMEENERESEMGARHEKDFKDDVRVAKTSNEKHIITHL